MSDELKPWTSDTPDTLSIGMAAYRERVPAQRVDLLWKRVEERLQHDRGLDSRGDQTRQRFNLSEHSTHGDSNTLLWIVGGFIAAVLGIVGLVASHDREPPTKAMLNSAAKKVHSSDDALVPVDHAATVDAVREPAAKAGDDAPQERSELKPSIPSSNRASVKNARPSRRGSKPSLSPVDEVTLLMRARSKIQSDPREALQYLEEHARVFPKGVFEQERELLAIEALINLGKYGPAQARGDAFLKSFSNSAHRVRLNRLLSR